MNPGDLRGAEVKDFHLRECLGIQTLGRKLWGQVEGVVSSRQVNSVLEM